MKIRNMASKCKFGNSAAKSSEIAMLDKLIMCVPQEVKEKLLQKSELTFDEAIKIVQAHNAAKYQAKELARNKTPEFNINRLKEVQGSRSTNIQCHRWGNKTHKADFNGCPAKNRNCNECGKKGHFGRMCQSKSGKKRPLEGPNQRSLFPAFKRPRLEVKKCKPLQRF